MLIMNADKEFKTSPHLGCRIWFFNDIVWYAPVCGIMDLKMPYKYEVEDYLNGIMEWV